MRAGGRSYRYVFLLWSAIAIGGAVAIAAGYVGFGSLNEVRIAPVFGSGALSVSPRVGHIHVTVDVAPWHWADASGTPLILRGLPPGRHTVLIELVDANHQTVDKDTVTFVVPNKATAVPSVPRR